MLPTIAPDKNWSQKINVSSLMWGGEKPLIGLTNRTVKWRTYTLTEEYVNMQRGLTCRTD